MSGGITDSHCHVWWDQFDEDRDLVLQRARDAGVERMVVVGTDVETSLASLDLAAREAELFGTAGMHPHEAANFGDDSTAQIHALCQRHDCVAVGETGLDWFKDWAPRERPSSPPSAGTSSPRARTLDKPVIIHSRDAHEDTLALVRELPRRPRRHALLRDGRGRGTAPTTSSAGLLHLLQRHRHLQGQRREPGGGQRRCPDERLLVETDAPFLAPGPAPRHAQRARLLRRHAPLRGAAAGGSPRTHLAPE